VSAAPAPASAPEPRCRFIEHRGKQILFHDLANITNPADGLPVIAQSKAIMVKQPLASVLTLTHVANSRFNKELVEGLTDLAKHNKPYVKAGAVVGLSGLQRVIYVTITQLSGRRLPTFDTLEAARNWLASQA
jgi:hypothetical protein